MSQPAKHPWIARLTVSLLILILAFLGLVLTDIRTTGGWQYWRWVIPVIALLALWLSWYLQKPKNPLNPIKLWHELLHWVGLIASVVIISLFVDLGILGRFEAALCILTLLSQAIFLAGLYIETTFLFIGVILALFTVGIALIEEYLYAVAIPLFFIGIGTIIWLIWHARKSKPDEFPPSE